MAEGKGVLASGAFRLKPIVNTGAYGVTAGSFILGAGDLMPLLSEGISESHEFQKDATLVGKAGQKDMILTGKKSGGSLTLQGNALGLDYIIAAALGWEKPSYNISPIFQESRNAVGALTGAVTTGAQATALTDATAFTNDADYYIGEYIRIQNATATGAAVGTTRCMQVRRITARPSTSELTITPNWRVNLVAGDLYEMARHFEHIFEPSDLMGREYVSDIYANWGTHTWGTDNSDFIYRFGMMVFDKQISDWQWEAAMVESLSFDLDTDGLTVTAEIVPIALNISGTPTQVPANWKYSAMPASVFLQERFRFADATFEIDDYATSGASLAEITINQFNLTVKNNLKIDDRGSASGLYILEPLRGAKREITGSFTIPRYSSDSLLTDFAADTAQMGQLKIVSSAVPPGTASVFNTIEFYLNKFKLVKPDIPIGGPEIIGEKWDIQFLVPDGIPDTGVPASTLEPTATGHKEITIVTNNGNPYNAFAGWRATTGSPGDPDS